MCHSNHSNICRHTYSHNLVRSLDAISTTIALNQCWQWLISGLFVNTGVHVVTLCNQQDIQQWCQPGSKVELQWDWHRPTSWWSCRWMSCSLHNVTTMYSYNVLRQWLLITSTTRNKIQNVDYRIQHGMFYRHVVSLHWCGNGLLQLLQSKRPALYHTN